ncbi:caudovirus prohead protease [Chryseobacterium sp. G0162]|uniref:caudovirus prohead protease n=1 Tax=Chryseobacterium sp. G0162 TaxID=2487063 RepID=UPI000F4F3F09|nr:caudovirus prohead protease [Chryseobacterium sp. G0162]AZB07445.1 caudovirus prohead protease [Chryseobacterium sp. G0162]
MSKQKFILNDETKKNQYGFRVRNSGLKLERFRNNPVMLDSHKGGNEAVIGRWEDIQIEGSLLTAVAVFDDEDPNASKIAGKVERGFIKGASLGLDPFSMSNFVLAPDDTYDLVESEVLEGSVVAIPNNANALTVKLYATSEESIRELVENEVSEILLMASDATKFNLNKQMKITLTLSAISALGLPGNTLEHDSAQVEANIIKLKSDLDAANLKITGFEELEKDKKAKLSADTVDADIKAGKIDATKKAEFIKLHAEMPDLYKTMVTDAPAKNNLSATTVPAVNAAEVKTLDDFQKLDLNAQLDFKNSNPEGYKALFK